MMAAMVHKDFGHSTAEALESGLVATPTTGTNEFLPETQRLFQAQKEEPSKPQESSTRNAGENFEQEHGQPDLNWMDSVQGKIDEAGQDDAFCSRKTVCIYRVPPGLRASDEKAYVPQIVSLGPFHRDKECLRQMDRHKWRALYHIRERTKDNIKLYFDSVKKFEERARNCYEEFINLKSSEFIEMMVLDSCFVLEFLQGAYQGFEKLGYSHCDPIFGECALINSIRRDMMMLENQIPLFILDELLGLQLGKGGPRVHVAQLIPNFFNAVLPSEKSSTDQGGLHCLDVFRRSLLNMGEEKIYPKFSKRKQQLIRSVTELREAGIKFKERKKSRFWDIDFKNGILNVPRIYIFDCTKSLLLNFIAFEQCHTVANTVTSYVVFMDNLINYQHDVAYLRYHGIIEHWLGSDAEVAELFNSLCKEVVIDKENSYLSSLSARVNNHVNRRCNTWRASLNHKYFSNPWAIISLGAAAALLLFTSLQTFYAVYGYHHPN